MPTVTCVQYLWLLPFGFITSITLKARKGFKRISRVFGVVFLVPHEMNRLKAAHNLFVRAICRKEFPAKLDPALWVPAPQVSML